MLSSASPLSDWLAWLETLSPSEINLGLERVRDVLARLDLPRPPHVLLVAGTNGKGSSVAMADALLRAAGVRTGAYTSPHILKYNERIVVAGVAASDAEIIAAFEQVEAVRGDSQLTYFEYGTLAAAVVFAAADLDVWILEVGLGGRLDATNAIEPTASLITNISLDHCDWLGNDVETIAAEKAGVMREGLPTVFGSRAIPQSILDTANATSVLLAKAGDDFDYRVDADGAWSWRGPTHAIDDLVAPGFKGEFQIANAAAVLSLLDVAGLVDRIDRDLINDVLPQVSLMGRMQSLSHKGVDWIFDVAHNPAAAKVLGETLASMDLAGEVIAVVGILDDKDIEGVVSPLAGSVDRWIAVGAESPRAIDAGELARVISNLTDSACLIANSVGDAAEIARRFASENDKILVTGSFFTVGPALSHLKATSQAIS